MRTARFTASALAFAFAVSQPAAAGQTGLKSSEVSAFLGTWVFTMSGPGLDGGQQTVRVWEKGGMTAASLQVGKFPPNDITGILKDGNVLVLTTTLRENGAPIWAVVALTLDGQTMTMAQMLERSQTIKRGAGQRVGP
jgi:hypothetical protein